MKKNNIYQRLFEISNDQSGYFSTQQAMEAGYSRPNLIYHTRRGKFIRIARGVYRLSYYPSSPHDDFFIAQLKTGRNSIISHASALFIYRLSDNLPGEIHITIFRTASRRQIGIRHHTKKITPDDFTLYEGLRVTTVPRTIIDLIESGFDPVQIQKAISDAIQRGLTTTDQLRKKASTKGRSLQGKIQFYIARIEN